MPEFDAPVPHYMSAPVYAVEPGISLDQAHELLVGWRVSAAAVVEAGELVGVLSRGDLLRVGRSEAEADGRGISLKLPEKTVAGAMSTGVVTVSNEATIRDAARIMVENSMHRLFVVGATGLVGVISTRDVMDAIANERIGGAISEHMTSPIVAIRAEQPIADALARITQCGLSGLVVLDDGWPVGVFTEEEALIGRDMPDGAAVEWAMNPAMLSLPHDTPLYRAAATASSMDVRRVIVNRGNLVEGVITGLDFCRAVAA